MHQQLVSSGSRDGVRLVMKQADSAGGRANGCSWINLWETKRASVMCLRDKECHILSGDNEARLFISAFWGRVSVLRRQIATSFVPVGWELRGHYASPRMLLANQTQIASCSSEITRQLPHNAAYPDCVLAFAVWIIKLLDKSSNCGEASRSLCLHGSQRRGTPCGLRVPCICHNASLEVESLYWHFSGDSQARFSLNISNSYWCVNMWE